MQRQGRRAAIIGQSRGGSFAKVLAQARPDLVAGIVTLGSPTLEPLKVHPLVRGGVEAVARLGGLGAPGLFTRACLQGDCCSGFWDLHDRPLPRGVGFTAVYSRSDGIVDWRSCLDPAAPSMWRSARATSAWPCIRTATAPSPDALDELPAPRVTLAKPRPPALGWHAPPGHVGRR